MLLRFIICDENNNESNRLSVLMKEYFSNKSLFTVEYVKVSSRRGLLAKTTHGCNYDCLFINAYADVNGAVDTVLALRECGFNGKVIFLIKHSDRMNAAFMHGAAGFLTKPIHFDRLVRLLDRLTGSGDEATVALQNGCAYEKLALNSITYIESLGGKCIVHLTDGRSETVSKSLCDVERELSGGRFLRCHRCYIVNMDHITGMDERFILDTGETVLIAQRSLTSSRRAVIAYYKEKKNQPQI